MLPPAHEISPYVVRSRDVDARVAIGAETDSPAKDFAKGGLREIGDNRSRIKQKDQVVVVSVEVKTTARSEQSMHAIDSGHNGVSLFLDRGPPQ